MSSRWIKYICFAFCPNAFGDNQNCEECNNTNISSIMCLLEVNETPLIVGDVHEVHYDKFGFRTGNWQSQIGYIKIGERVRMIDYCNFYEYSHTIFHWMWHRTDKITNGAFVNPPSFTYVRNVKHVDTSCGVMGAGRFCVTSNQVHFI